MAIICLPVLIFVIFGCSGNDLSSQAIQLAQKIDAMEQLEGLVESMVNKTEKLDNDLAFERTIDKIVANKNDFWRNNSWK